MKAYTAVIERDPQTGLFVGFVPGFRGAHSQAATLDELVLNLQEVIAMLLEEGEPELESEFVGAILRRLGFVDVRQRGSHKQFRDSAGRCTTVPFHPGRDIAPTLLR